VYKIAGVMENCRHGSKQGEEEYVVVTTTTLTRCLNWNEKGRQNCYGDLTAAQCL
jgi:hypothetical protein